MTPPAVAEPANAVVEYAEQNPRDFVGINALAEKEFGTSIQFSVSNVDGPVDAATADMLSNQKTLPPGTIEPSAVPIDAFGVVGYWLPTAGRAATYMGTWDFRDDYVNGSEPDDFASIMFDWSSSCLAMTSTTYNSYYYDGTRTTDSTMYLKDGGISGAPITGLRDAVDGFQLNVDHGHMSATVTRKLGCDAQPFGAQFAYEHNQDGGSVLSVSASFLGGLSISYGGAPSTLQKSNSPTYISF
ncbi:hypothetical protein [Rhodococcus sp. HNM0569]|uniref:hypothetical protein n=1 Tax=Rhodococcus sp. HNM0569 TaxID=2716340 RepID=UPI00146D19A4|nr:hypothetical protein [Rhodococcus sp. HNM0569]NLU82153.1 hypothetical protein [Rhodococcus sp. HNM0569]